MTLKYANDENVRAVYEKNYATTATVDDGYIAAENGGYDDGYGRYAADDGGDDDYVGDDAGDDAGDDGKEEEEEEEEVSS